MDLSTFSGTRAPGSSDVPNYPDNDEDDNDDDDNNKGEMSVGAIGGIVVGAIAAFILAVIIVVKCGREIVPKNQHVQSVSALPAAVSYSAPTSAYPPYDPWPGVPVHSTSIDVAPPSYDQAMSSGVQASAPPYNPYYKGVIAF